MKRTGHCFEEAGTFVMLIGQDWTLVHGIPTLQIHPFKRYGHAWVEKNGIVKDLNNNKEIPVWLYYLVGKINPAECKRYTLDNLRKMVLKYKHWGPWDLPGDIL